MVNPQNHRVDRTESLCPVCLERISADVIVRGNSVLLIKECVEHGSFECPHAWDNPAVYSRMMLLGERLVKDGVKDATISVTRMCNMSCPFCFDTARDDPKMEAILERAAFSGAGNILLYGGEPTERKDLPQIVKGLKSKGFGVVLLTNGLNIGPGLVSDLKMAGLDGVLLQLDSLDDKINVRLRGLPIAKRKIRAVEALKGSGIWVSFFVVLVKGEHIRQIQDIIPFAAKNSAIVRSVIFTLISPEGKTGFPREYVSNAELFEATKTAGFSLDDFLVCTEFEVSLSRFLSKIRVPRKTIALCELVCYAYSDGSKAVPLGRLIDMRKLKEALDRSNSIPSLLWNLFMAQPRFDWRLALMLWKLPHRVLYSKIMMKPFYDKFDGVFAVVFNPTQNRYNADYRLLASCNLYSDFKGEFMTFCEQNILSSGVRDIGSLDFKGHVRSIFKGPFQ